MFSLECATRKAVCKRKRYECGFSFVEMLVILGLISALILIVMPQFNQYLQNWRIESGAAQIAVNLRFARNAAVKQKLQYRIIINENPTNTYRIEKWNNFTDHSFVAVPGIDTSLPRTMKIDQSSTDGPIVFDLTGGANGSFDLNLIALNGRKYKITVTPLGGVSITKTAS